MNEKEEPRSMMHPTGEFDITDEEKERWIKNNPFPKTRPKEKLIEEKITEEI